MTPGGPWCIPLVMAAGLGRRTTHNLAAEQVTHMSSERISDRSAGRSTLAIVLVILGILAIIAGFLYLAGAANSIHFMVGSVHQGHHLARAAVSFVVGIALLIVAWFISRTRQ